MQKAIIFCIAGLCLVACSKKTSTTSTEVAPEVGNTENSAREAVINIKKNAASNNVFLRNVKQDFAAQFITDASEACAKVVGNEAPVSNSGSAIHYTASGIQWANQTLDYINEPGAKITFINSIVEKTFSIGIDIYNENTSDRMYVANLSQLHGESLSATITDETKAESSGNICAGSKPPVVAQEGAWNLAVKYMQFKPTKMSCAKLASVDFSPIEFAFDGAEIHAGYNTFAEEDAQHSESFFIDSDSDKAPLMYQVSASEGRSVTIGINDQKELVYAAISSADTDDLFCSPVK